MPKLEISIIKQTLQFLEFLDFLDYALDFYSSIVKCLVQAKNKQNQHKPKLKPPLQISIKD